MRDLARILLPIDFSERSVGPARYAMSLAKHFGSELTLLHVLTPLQYEYGALEISGSMLSELYRSRTEQAMRELEAFLPNELAGPNVRRVVLEGDPAAKIVDLAHGAPDQTVVLMPTHGYGPFRRFILGSTTAKVLHDADCPVWTGVHLEEAPALASIPFHNILCAVDLGPQSAKALCWAARMTREFNAALHVLHVLPAGPGLADGADDPASNWQIPLRKSAGEELRRLLSSVGVEGEAGVESGEPGKAICATAGRVKADLLVIGRGSAAGVFGRLRTNAYAIIRESPCPVVSV
ncbi:MAG TPA: universal stress protein [Bryobacteraceae bacterium]|nr:universal stress protein [Bryobacteraceae bacterium]